MLEVRHLVKRYLGVTAVNDVSFAVSPGEVVGYLGPNGSGKSTTVRMLTRLTAPTSGAVWFAGTDTSRDPVGFRRRFGYVPEEPQLYPFLSGREYLELVGRLREMPAVVLDRKIPALLELFSMSGAAEQPIAGYSKGMKQRVLIIAALLHDPELLVFDEPDSGLDVGTALVLRHLIRILAARGKAILYSSHVLESVEAICTRVIVLHGGRIVAEGPVEALRTGLNAASLEQVFAQLARRDPEQTAGDIADVVHAGAS